MKAIYKYPMPIQEKIEVILPKGSTIIRVSDVDGLFFLWAIVDIEIEETEARHIEFYKTGQPIEEVESLIYLGLCKLFIMQELGLYTFERINTIQPFTT